jgi:hypothetical protein
MQYCCTGSGGTSVVPPKRWLPAARAAPANAEAVAKILEGNGAAAAAADDDDDDGSGPTWSW